MTTAREMEEENRRARHEATMKYQIRLLEEEIRATQNNLDALLDYLKLELKSVPSKTICVPIEKEEISQ